MRFSKPLTGISISSTLGLFLLVVAVPARSQKPTNAVPPPAPAPAPTTGKKTRNIAYWADSYTAKETPAGTVLTLSNKVKLTSEDTTLLTELATLNNTTKIANSPGRLQIDDSQNTIIGDRGVAYYKSRDAKITGTVHITARPKPGDRPAAEGSLRKEFKSPVQITCDNVDYNWRDRVAVATGHLTMHSEDRTVTADRADYYGKEERVVLTGHVHYTRPNGEHGDADKAIALLKEGQENFEVQKNVNGVVIMDEDEEDNGTGAPAKPQSTSTNTPRKPDAKTNLPAASPTPVAPSSPTAPTNTPPPTTPTTPPATDPANNGGPSKL